MTLAAGMVFGVLAIGTVRFFATSEYETHYHANFAVYINGVRQEFEGPQYYQEVTACNTQESPLARTHMHNQQSHLVHVHDNVVTWASFFENLGWSLHNDMLYDGKTAYVDGRGGELSFVLNGKPVRSVAGEIIGNEDRLLISFGNDADVLSAQYDSIPHDAPQANHTNDPAGCKGARQHDFWARAQRAFWF